MLGLQNSFSLVRALWLTSLSQPVETFVVQLISPPDNVRRTKNDKDHNNRQKKRTYQAQPTVEFPVGLIRLWG